LADIQKMDSQRISSLAKRTSTQKEYFFVNFRNAVKSRGEAPENPTLVAPPPPLPPSDIPMGPEPPEVFPFI
jgi:hypothetical protein